MARTSHGSHWPPWMERNRYCLTRGDEAYDAEEKSKKEPGPTLPSDPLQHESKAATVVSNNTSETKLKGNAANVQINQGAKASFNLFAGMQAGIELPAP